MSDNQFGAARGASQQVAAAWKACAIQYRFLGLLITICAYIMRRFAAAHRFFDGVGERAVTDIGELISLLLCYPCFEASNFFFEITYALQQRRALILCRQRGIVGIDKFALEFEELGLKGLTVVQRYHRLRNILSAIERRNGSGDCADVRHDAFSNA